MTTGKPLSGLLAGGVVMLAVAVAGAQQEIPTALSGKSAAFTAADEAVINKWVQPLAEQLAAGKTPEQVATARAKLLEPTRRPGLSVEFAQAYAQLVGRALQPALVSDQPLVRQNALVVAAQLPGAPVGLFVKGLSDPHPAVRYWAAKGAALATTHENLLPSDQQQAQLMTAISQAMTKETSGPVVEQLYLALSGLRLPQARMQLLNGLEVRAQTYASGGLDMQIRGELAALRRVSKELVNEAARQQVNRDQIIKLVTVSGKYLQVIRQAVAAGLKDEIKPVVLDMVGLIEQVLNWGVGIFDPSAKSGPALLQPLRTGDGATFQLHVIDWVGTKDAPGLLSKSRIAIPHRALQLTGP